MKFWIILYHHRHGTDTWPVFSERKPTEKQIIESLEDWEGEVKNEWIEIVGPFTVPEND